MIKNATLMLTLIMLVTYGNTVSILKAAASGPPFIRFVSILGEDSGDCTDWSLPCQTIQYAINVADQHDEIRIAQGTYTDTSNHVGVIDKTIILTGGWNDDFTHQDLSTFPSILDGNGKGSVIQIYGPASPIITSLIIKDGNATENTYAGGKGGGIYSENATPNIFNNILEDNIANSDTTTGGYGGAIHISNAPETAVIRANRVLNNIASVGHYGYGGGIYLENSTAIVIDNTIHGNIAMVLAQINAPPPPEPYQGTGGGIAVIGGSVNIENNNVFDNLGSASGRGGGGGIYVGESSFSTISGNIVEGNVSSQAYDGVGGGIAVYKSQSPIVIGNTIRNNIASEVRIGKGGGLCLKLNDDPVVEMNFITNNIASLVFTGHGGGIFTKLDADSVISNNVVISNTASLTGGGQGGGIFFRFKKTNIQDNIIFDNLASDTGIGQGGGVYGAEGEITLFHNSIERNTASISGSGYGGGIGIWQVNGLIDSNFILANNASQDNEGHGGGVYTIFSSTFALINNIIAKNQASSTGSGFIFIGSTTPTNGNLVNNTIADNNFGSGEGIRISGSSVITLTNNIISGNKFGIFTGKPESTASANYTLYFDNEYDTGGFGFIDESYTLHNNPSFQNSSLNNYHLRSSSAAIDCGDPAGVPPAPARDIDGDPRPIGDGIDIGADEFYGLAKMRIIDINLRYLEENNIIIAEILLAQEDNEPVPGALVSVDWVLPNNQTLSREGITNSNGVAVMKMRFKFDGKYLITIHDVNKDGWLYVSDANKVTSASIEIP